MTKIMVRPATKDDFAFIEELARESVEYGIPTIREVKGQELRDTMGRAYKNLANLYETQEKILVLLAEDSDKNCRVGYVTLILDEVESSTGEKQTFIQDLAVKKSYWGKYVVHRLIRRAEEETSRRGFRYITGSVAVDNARTVGTAKAMGYAIERYQIVKKL
ncbi:MAG: GNAT family N-acetyltransferase [Candidatus Eremiobacteraeota bacterium]|nr:GNAT family N-acetyltransferase [Candidatus Eremiobacteraeota bacterium]